MTNLSPAAQNVRDAFRNASDCKIAAALRAVADEIAPREDEIIDNCWYEKSNPIREQLLSIAAELEND